MDSPEPAKLTISTASDSPPVQDSPFFNYISNLSPIKHVRSTHVTRELSRLNSPPIVFKSPRTKQYSETNILKRSYSLQLSSPRESQSINRGEERIDGPVDTEQLIAQSELIAETQKGCDVAGSLENHPSSSSGCVDEFLADPGEADCVSSAKLATPILKQSVDAHASYRSGSKDSKETLLQFDDKNGMWMDAERNLDALLELSEHNDNDIQGGLESGVKSTEIAEEQRDGKWPSYTCSNPETRFPVGHAFNKQSRQNSQSQGIEHDHHNDCESASQPSPDLFPIQTFEEKTEDIGGISGGLVENKTYNNKASENQRGVLRRCLQFEEAPPYTIRYNDSSSNSANTVSSSKPSNSTTDLETFKSSHVESKETSERPMANLPQSTPALSRSRSSENISMASKPLGIGLHLNSIVNAASCGCTVTESKKSTDHHMAMGETKSGMNENSKSCPMPSSMTEKDSASNEERTGSTKALIVASSVTNKFLQAVEDLRPAQDENGKYNHQNADRFEEIDQPSSIKKRKKATGSDGGDGCKRCNCKKSKCLKLYCDCFAAGVYCTDPCSCQGCFNRPEYKDTVLETRQQIESRNPLAFAPKVVQRSSELPTNNGEAGNYSTPSSARHKRGCNCKRSMCLKKYCECYQANVGCSSGCRCEGCKNVYGKKEEYVAIEHGATREIMGDVACKEQLESTFDKESEMMETNMRDLLCSELINPHHLTPLTPSLQHSDHGKDAPKSRFLPKKYLPSPDSDLSILSSYEKPTKSSPGDVENGDILLEAGEALQNEGSYDLQADYNMGKAGSIPLRCNAASNAHHITELSDPPVPVTSLNPLIRTGCTNVSQNQQRPGSDHFLSRSLTRHGSPLTPMTRLGETKPNQGPNSSCELIEILEGDETPVKVSSPNKKRVSPPLSHIYKLGSGSSGALRSGRKFILKSVPSFPPLTPCIDSKGNSISQDKLRDNSSIKK